MNNKHLLIQLFLGVSFSFAYSMNEYPGKPLGDFPAPFHVDHLPQRDSDAINIIYGFNDPIENVDIIIARQGDELKVIKEPNKNTNLKTFRQFLDSKKKESKIPKQELLAVPTRQLFPSHSESKNPSQFSFSEIKTHTYEQEIQSFMNDDLVGTKIVSLKDLSQPLFSAQGVSEFLKKHFAVTQFGGKFLLPTIKDFLWHFESYQEDVIKEIPFSHVPFPTGSRDIEYDGKQIRGTIASPVIVFPLNINKNTQRVTVFFKGMFGKNNDVQDDKKDINFVINDEYRLEKDYKPFNPLKKESCAKQCCKKKKFCCCKNCEIF